RAETLHCYKGLQVCRSTQRALVGWDWLNIEGKNSPYGKRLAQPIMGKTKKETGDDADSRKALEICKNLQALKMTPKEFMITFLTSKNSDLASRRRLWTIDNGHVRSLHLVRCIDALGDQKG
ncbi:hypothetical protein PSTG_18783, partial [Puccinia striiformis f. sp. tritici PST-78]